MSARFLPRFWNEVKAKWLSNLLGVITAVFVLLAQIHYGVITGGVHPRLLSILWPYGLLALAFSIYHLARTPWLISNEHLDVIADLNNKISKEQEELQQKDNVIQILKEKPPKTPAEQNDYDIAKKALQVVREKGITALRYIRRHGSMKFGFGVCLSPLPPGMNFQDTVWVFNHCASVGVLHCEEKFGSGEKTFSVLPQMSKILDEILYEEGPIYEGQ